MIPLRVHVQGFMSYRDAVTFQFDGAPLWILVGPNGAGKSAIFDAILFALYGAHRGGRENSRALINQQANSLLVEFDFTLGNAIYRAKRTLSKKGNSTCGIFHLNAQPVERAVPGTEKQKEFDAWVAQHIGLDEQTFTAAVLLQQGKSEALLNAQPKDRHQILSQLVDISRYERLAKKADERQKQFEVQERTFAGQANALPPVQQAEIDALAEKIEKWQEQWRAAQTELQELARLQVHCVNWTNLEKERTEIKAALDAASELSRRTEEIERDAERWQALDTNLPRVRAVRDTRQRICDAQAKIEAHTRAAATCRAEVEHAAQELGRAQAHETELREQQINAQRGKDAAQSQLLALAPAMQQLEQLEKLRAQVSAHDSNLAENPTDLDSQLAELESELGALEELRAALPQLEMFATARTRWNDAQNKLEETRERWGDWESQRAQVSAEHSALAQEIDAAHSRAEELKEAWGAAKTRLADAQAAVGRFQQVESAPTCLYCGQTLTPAHLDQERTRLEKQNAEAKAYAQHAQSEFQEASEHHQFLVGQSQTMERTLRQLELDISGATQAIRLITRECERAERDGRTSWYALPASYREPFAEWEDDFTRLFQQEYPSADELEAQRAHTRNYDTRRKERIALEPRVKERTRIATLREDAISRVRDLEILYSAKDAARIRREHADATTKQNDAEQWLAVLVSKIALAERDVKKWAAAVEQAQGALHRTETDKGREMTRLEELTRVLAAQEQQLAQDWRTIVETLDEKGWNALEQEYRALASAVQERETLREARTQHTARTTRLEEIKRALDKIPQGAKRPRHELERAEKHARENGETADRERNRAAQQKLTLEGHRDRRAQFEEQRGKAAERAQRYKELAQFLGRDYLQRHLLQQAEQAIVQQANRTLDRLSGGMMRLELRALPTPKRKRAAKTMGVKALDLVAHNRATAQEPLPVYLLSGSQRFRVAVSLALGIGQWRGAQTHDAVIIDEGFGSLDKEGRRQMVDELHALTNVLGRILLVSHQEEFADAFVNRYIVELRDGTSHARLAERDE